MGHINYMRNHFLAINMLAQNYDYTKRGFFKGKKNHLPFETELILYLYNLESP